MGRCINLRCHRNNEVFIKHDLKDVKDSDDVSLVNDNGQAKAHKVFQKV